MKQFQFTDVPEKVVLKEKPEKRVVEDGFLRGRGEKGGGGLSGRRGRRWGEDEGKCMFTKVSVVETVVRRERAKYSGGTFSSRRGPVTNDPLSQDVRSPALATLTSRVASPWKCDMQLKISQ